MESPGGGPDRDKVAVQAVCRHHGRVSATLTNWPHTGEGRIAAERQGRLFRLRQPPPTRLTRRLVHRYPLQRATCTEPSSPVARQKPLAQPSLSVASVVRDGSSRRTTTRPLCRLLALHAVAGNGSSDSAEPGAAHVVLEFCGTGRFGPLQPRHASGDGSRHRPLAVACGSYRLTAKSTALLVPRHPHRAPYCGRGHSALCLRVAPRADPPPDPP